MAKENLVLIANDWNNNVRSMHLNDMLNLFENTDHMKSKL